MTWIFVANSQGFFHLKRHSFRWPSGLLSKSNNINMNINPFISIRCTIVQARWCARFRCWLSKPNSGSSSTSSPAQIWPTGMRNHRERWNANLIFFLRVTHTWETTNRPEVSEWVSGMLLCCTLWCVFRKVDRSGRFLAQIWGQSGVSFYVGIV